MSGTFPTDPAPASVTLEGKQPTAVSFSESGKSQARIIGGHLWASKFSWSTMTRGMLSPIFAFVNQQRGRFGTFQIVLPNYAVPNGVWGGAVSVVGAHAAGSESIAMTGFNPNSSFVVKAGDIFKFASHSKVYMAIADENSIGNEATINIIPPLIQAVADTEAITFNDVPFTMSFDDDVILWKGSAPNMATISVDMTESL